MTLFSHFKRQWRNYNFVEIRFLSWLFDGALTHVEGNRRQNRRRMEKEGIKQKVKKMKKGNGEKGIKQMVEQMKKGNGEK